MSSQEKNQEKIKIDQINSEDKYWLKTGVIVKHRDFLDVKMIVDRVVKSTRKIKDLKGEEIVKTFVVGVDVHWLDKEMKYSSGRFLTIELLKWEQKINTQKQETEKATS
jgi:hypothetical protein